MTNINEGMAGAIGFIVDGIIATAIFSAFATIESLKPYSYLLILTSLIGTIVLLFTIPKWGTGYTIGWLIAIILLWDTGLISWEMLLSFLVVLVVLSIRIKTKWEDFIS